MPGMWLLQPDWTFMVTWLFLEHKQLFLSEKVGALAQGLVTGVVASPFLGEDEEMEQQIVLKSGQLRTAGPSCFCGVSTGAVRPRGRDGNRLITEVALIKSCWGGGVSPNCAPLAALLPLKPRPPAHWLVVAEPANQQRLHLGGCYRLLCRTQFPGAHRAARGTSGSGPLA